MYSIILKPMNNEKDLLQKALQLGYTHIYFLYTQPQKISKHTIAECTSKTISQFRKRCATLMITTSDQTIFEQTKPDIVMGLEKINSHDRTHQRLSGFNHVLAKLARKNNISLLYNIPELANATLLGRNKQNIMLCNKYNVNIILTSLVSDPSQIPAPHDIISTARLLGITQPAKTITYSFSRE